MTSTSRDRLALLTAVLGLAACGDGTTTADAGTTQADSSAGESTSGSSSGGPGTASLTGDSTSTDPGSTGETTVDPSAGSDSSSSTDASASDSSSGGSSDGSSSGGAASSETTAANPCDSDMIAPAVTSALDAIVVEAGTTSVQYTLSFDEPVELAVGAVSISGGATISAPSLPAQGTDFDLTIDDLDPGTSYTLSVNAAAIADSCGNALAQDETLDLIGACTLDQTPPTLTSAAFVQLDPDTTASVIQLDFDEPVALEDADLALANGATIDSVEPALPATASSFAVSVSGLVDLHDLTISGFADACGNAAADASLTICVGNSARLDFTGGEQQFVVPPCADGSVFIEAYGAQGADATGADPGTAGLGGYAAGDLSVASGEVLYVFVGGRDGYNGGGAAGTGNTNASGNGGGATDVRYGDNTLADRVIVAGGGGGAAGDAEGSCIDATPGNGGEGGHPDGGGGSSGFGCAGEVHGGGGGAQATGGLGGISAGNCSTSGGSGADGDLGLGGNGGSGVQGCGGYTGAGGGGGGGGFYGGGGGAGGPGGGGGSWAGGGGGGGASYIDGVDGGVTIDGAITGDGSVVISW